MNILYFVWPPLPCFTICIQEVWFWQNSKKGLSLFFANCWDFVNHHRSCAHFKTIISKYCQCFPTHIKLEEALWAFTWQEEIIATVLKQLCLKSLEFELCRNVTSSTNKTSSRFFRKRNISPVSTVSLKYSAFYDCPLFFDELY